MPATTTSAIETWEGGDQLWVRVPRLSMPGWCMAMDHPEDQFEYPVSDMDGEYVWVKIQWELN